MTQAPEAARGAPLTGLSLLALGVNGIVGVGIFFAPAEVAKSVPGYAGSLVYLVVGLALLPIAWTFGALGGRFGVDGGPYVWARAAFGPTFAFFVGWVTCVAAVFSTAAVVSGFGRYAGAALGIQTDMGTRLFAVVAATVLAGIAATGLRPSAFTWTAVTVLKLLPLAALVCIGVAVFGSSAPAAVPPPTERLERAALIAVFSSQGFEIVPVVAGSTRRSDRVVLRATLGSLIVAAILYAAIHAVCVSALPALAQSSTPLVDAARVLGGERAASLVSAGANVSSAGIAFGMLVMTPRYLAALGTKEALGSWLGVTDVRLVPQRALWIVAAVVLVLIGWGELGDLFVLSSIAVLAQYAVCAAFVFRFARSGEHGFGRRDLWIVPVALVSIVLSSFGADRKELLSAAAVLATGAVLFFARTWSTRASTGSAPG